MKCPSCGYTDEYKLALPNAPVRPNGYKAIIATFGKPDLPGATGNVPLARFKVPDSFKRLPYLAKGYSSCHKLIKDRVEWVFAELERRGISNLIKSYDGCYNPRPKRGGSDPSVHAWAIAIDINAGENPMGGKNKIDKRVIAVFEEAGFYQLPGDPMHFQYAINY